MNKEDILAKNVKVKSYEDEREIYINDKARVIASSFFLSILSIILVYKVIKGINTSDLNSILLTFLSVEALYKYHQLKNKHYLILGIITAIGAIAGLIEFFFIIKS